MLDDIFCIKDNQTKRISSRDRNGANADFIRLPQKKSVEIANIDKAGVIRHIWCTLSNYDEENSRKNRDYVLRNVLLQIYWDDEKHPSVNVPIGDFFGMGHGIARKINSLMVSMNPTNARGFNSHFPMPFSNARIVVANQGKSDLDRFYFNIDYEETDVTDDMARFHAQWRRENPTAGWGDNKTLGEIFKTSNKYGEKNYVILEAEGGGHYIGCNLNVHAFKTQKDSWFGEGDEMIFIDCEKEPSICGTGTEDYFGCAWGYRQEFSGLYVGVPLYTIDPSTGTGRASMYRFHILDPIRFKKSIRVTIEHGHANHLSHDYSSTAYWYQKEPHKEFKILPLEKRIPRD